MDSPIDGLIARFARLPGLGPRSARRLVLQLLRQKEKLMLPLAQALSDTAGSITSCSVCRNLDTSDPCGYCRDPHRDPHTICVVEDVADLWAIERCHRYGGVYHVLGGTLSAIDGRGPEALGIDALLERITPGSQEVILALNATVEGQTTAHYITDQLNGRNVRITRLAQGIPIGGELDYLDDGTLGAALLSRQTV